MTEIPSLPDGDGSRRGHIAGVFKLAQAAAQRTYETMHQLFGSVDASTQEPQCTGTAGGQDGTSEVAATFSSLAIGNIPLPTRVSKAGPPADPLAQQQGKIEWVHGYFYAESPEWRCEIDTAVIKEIVEPQLEAHGIGTKDISIEFFAAGGLNKLYTVSSSVKKTGQRQECIFRVAMPLDPWYKTESEVATIEYVRRYTSIPVPKIYAYDSSTDNKLGFEWIMMEKIAGKPLFDFWDVHGYERDLLDMDTKLQLARTVAEWVHQLSKLRFEMIGSLYIDWDNAQPRFKIGRIVEGNYFRGRRLAYKVFRGPFKNLEQVYRSEVELQLQDIHDPSAKTYFEARIARIQQADKEEAEAIEKATKEGRTIPKSPVGKIDWQHVDDEDDWYFEVDFERIPRACHALLSVIPAILIRESYQDGPTMLSHRDMSFKNVLLDDSGSAVGLVDWEMTVAEPPVLITHYPDVVNMGGSSVNVLPAWSGNTKDRERLHNEMRHEQYLMREEFRRYLKEKKSPRLQVLEKQPRAMRQLQRRVYDIGNQARELGDWVKCMEDGKEWITYPDSD